MEECGTGGGRGGEGVHFFDGYRLILHLGLPGDTT